MPQFIGRREELKVLRSLLKKKSASFVVIRGRRRIGKSRLIQEFGQSAPCYLFSGLPPSPDMSKQSQIDAFLAQMSRLFKMPQLMAKNWGDVFWLLNQQISQGTTILALDEISWIGSKDSSFLGELKNAWDLLFSKNPRLILIVCGSISSWIQKNILGHTGFVGRISLDLQLKELPLHDCVKFWGSRWDHLSSYEIFKVLSATGGIPRYLEEIRPNEPAEENIKRLCFRQEGFLFREYDQMFSDLFAAKSPLYTKVLEVLSTGPQTVQGLAGALGLKRGGRVTEHLRNLALAGFVTEQPTWSLHTCKMSQLKHFRLSDNYVRFYLRCIRPNRERIAEGLLGRITVNDLPGWDTILGLQFENLVLKNALGLLDRLGIDPTKVVRLGPFFQRKNGRNAGCQVDLLIQSQAHTLFLCEIKFSADRVGMDVAHQIHKKMRNIAIPRGWSIRPVLVHINGCTSDLQQSDAFDQILDFGELLARN